MRTNEITHLPSLQTCKQNKKCSDHPHIRQRNKADINDNDNSSRSSNNNGNSNHSITTAIIMISRILRAVVKYIIARVTRLLFHPVTNRFLPFSMWEACRGKTRQVQGVRHVIDLGPITGLGEVH